MEEQEYLGLANLCMGAAIERFDDALKDVLRNIADPNTTLGARAITLKVTFKPEEDRGFCHIDISCQPKLAPPAPLGTKAFISVNRNGAVATEYHPAQQTLDFGQDAGRIVSIVGGSK